MTMMVKPDHQQALKAWCEVTKDCGEASVLIIPVDDGVVCAAFRPTETQGMAMNLVAAAAALRMAGNMTHEFPWTAVVTPSFVSHWEPGDPEPQHGDLQKAYVEGDMRVREVITVVIAEMDGPIWAQAFSQPFLEPLDEPVVVEGGEIGDGLTALMVASSLTD